MVQSLNLMSKKKYGKIAQQSFKVMGETVPQLGVINFGKQYFSYTNPPPPLCMYLNRSPPPLSFPTPGKTVPHHPLGDSHQVAVPHTPPLGDRTNTVKNSA